MHFFYIEFSAIDSLIVFIEMFLIFFEIRIETQESRLKNRDSRIDAQEMQSLFQTEAADKESEESTTKGTITIHFDQFTVAIYNSFRSWQSHFCCCYRLENVFRFLCCGVFFIP
jgi:hypothetical protein